MEFFGTVGELHQNNQQQKQFRARIAAAPTRTDSTPQQQPATAALQGTNSNSTNNDILNTVTENGDSSSRQEPRTPTWRPTQRPARGGADGGGIARPGGFQFSLLIAAGTEALELRAKGQFGI